MSKRSIVPTQERNYYSVPSAGIMLQIFETIAFVDKRTTLVCVVLQYIFRISEHAVFKFSNSI